MSRHSLMAGLFSLVVGLLTAVVVWADEPGDPWEDVFEGDGLSLVLEAVGGGAYIGQVQEGFFQFAVEGQASGAVLEGSYSIWGLSTRFRARLDGDRMTLETDEDTYVLARQGTTGQTASAPVVGAGGEAMTPPDGVAVAPDGGLAGPSVPVGADEVDEPAWGLRFRVPDGWQLAQREADSLILGSGTLPGVLLLRELEIGTLAELRAMVSGALLDDGVRLIPKGAPEAIGDAALGVEVEGSIGSDRVRGYVVGVISPHGPGLTILAVTEQDRYEALHRSAARDLADSVAFRARPVFGNRDWWHNTLSGQRIARHSRTSSSGAGGSTSRTTVTLCRDGRAGYDYFYQMSLSVPGVSASDSDQDRGEGRWEVVQRGRNPVLLMHLSDGRVLEWTLSYQNDRIHLDGREYLRDTPAC